MSRQTEISICIICAAQCPPGTKPAYVVEEALVVLKCRGAFSYNMLEDELVRFLIDPIKLPQSKTMSDSVLDSIVTRLDAYVCYHVVDIISERDSLANFVVQISQRLQTALWMSVDLDSWSELKMHRKYFGVAITYLGPERDAVPLDLMIEFSFSKESETAENLLERMTAALKKYKVNTDLIVTLISDRGSNMKKAAELSGFTVHFCFAHAAHNLATTSLASLKSVIDLKSDLRNLLSKFTAANKASQDLEATQRHNGLTVKRLESFYDQRWNCFFLSMMTLLGVGESLAETMNKIFDADYGIRRSQLMLLSKVLLVLQPLKDFTDRIVNKPKDNEINIYNLMSSSIFLFLHASLQCMTLIQDWWEHSGRLGRAMIRLDDAVDDENWRALAASFAVIFLQCCRHYFFGRLLEDHERHPDSIILPFVGASLDEKWQKATQLAKQSSLLPLLDVNNPATLDHQHFSKDFLTFSARCKQTRGSMLPVLRQNVLADVIIIGNPNLDDDDCISPLAKSFESVELEDMVKILFNLQASFELDITRIGTQLNPQLKTFVHRHNMMDVSHSNDSSTEESAQVASALFSTFSAYTGFDHIEILDGLRNLRGDGAVDGGMEQAPIDGGFDWDRLRTLSLTRAPSMWRVLPSSDSKDVILLGHIHRALSVVHASGAKLEQLFSKATCHLDDLQCLLGTAKFGKEVKIGANYPMIGFSNWLSMMSWDKPIGQEEIAKFIHDYDAKSSSSPQLSVSSAYGNTMTPPTSASSSSQNIFSRASSTSSIGRSSSIQVISPTPTRPSSTSNVYTRPVARNIRQELVQNADNFVRSVESDGQSLATSKHRKRNAETHKGLDEIAVDKAKERSNKRKANSAVEYQDSSLSERRNRMLSHLNKSGSLENNWHDMMNDPLCRIEGESKFFEAVWQFAVSQKQTLGLLNKMKDLLRKQLKWRVVLTEWRESIEANLVEIVDLDSSSTTTSDPTPQASALATFLRLPGVKIRRLQTGATFDRTRNVLQAWLKHNGLEERPVPAIGNCYYESCSRVFSSLSNEEQQNLRDKGLAQFSPEKIRQFAVDTISKSWNKYREFRTHTTGIGKPEAKTLWLARMRKDGVWADHVVSQALADRLGIEFIILRDDESVIYIESAHPTRQPSTIVLILHGERHYNATGILPSQSDGDTMDVD